MADGETPPPKVFISYSWDSPEHLDRVLELSNRLRADGIDSILDQYEVAPPEGWQRWMERQIEEADFVLVICTARYLRRVRGKEKPDVENGVRWESVIMYQALYDAGTLNAKFIPVLFEGASASDIPIPIKSTTRYFLITDDDYVELYRRLTNQPLTLKPALGKLRKMPPRVRKHHFLFSELQPDQKNLQEQLARNSGDIFVLSEQIKIVGEQERVRAEQAAAIVGEYEKEAAAITGKVQPEDRLAFTVGYPGVVSPEIWYSLLIYLHIASGQSSLIFVVRPGTRKGCHYISASQTYLD
jgi:hypothetical protein